MTDQSLADALQSAGGPIELLRDLGVGRFTSLPDEFTNWIEEQRSWRETCALYDQSYHMSDLAIEGPEALDVYRDLTANGYDGFEVGNAKQLVITNPDGYMIGDAILFYLDEERFLSVGPEAGHNWLDYHVETGDYDAAAELQGRPVATGEDPNYFRFQIQGPNAVEVLQAVTPNPLSDIPFFNFDVISIGGHDVRALRHGMAGERGFELFGPYEHKSDVQSAILDAGEERGIRRVGATAYQTTPMISGWMPLPVPAIYDSPAMADYREWLDARRGMISIGGSYNPDDVTDYYVTPVEIGYGHIVDLDHDFPGRDAVADQLEDPAREKVTLVWDDEDVVDLYRTMYDDGDTYKYYDLPVARWSACHYDEVLKDGDRIGVSKWNGYVYNERELLSLALLDVDHAEPGTEVRVVWGEDDPSQNPHVEDHVQTEVRATVAEVPYVEDRRSS